MRKEKHKIIIWLFIIAFLCIGLTSCSNNNILKEDEGKTLQDALDELTAEGDFEGVVNLLTTPEKLANYETRHFTHYLVEHEELPGEFLHYSPKEMFYKQVGTCSDFSAFETYVLDQHNYEFLLYTI